jgi:hypothetical protein
MSQVVETTLLEIRDLEVTASAKRKEVTRAKAAPQPADPCRFLRPWEEPFEMMSSREPRNHGKTAWMHNSTMCSKSRRAVEVDLGNRIFQRDFGVRLEVLGLVS